jgi:hypothetical protein
MESITVDAGLGSVAIEAIPPPQSSPVRCDFCGRDYTEVGPMIEGKALRATGRPISRICARCVALWMEHPRRSRRTRPLP